MSLRSGALTFGRALADGGMSETIEAGYETAGEDPVTFQPTAVFVVESSGRAEVKYPTLTSSSRNSGGQQYETAEIIVKRPHGAPLIAPERIIRVTASNSDASLVGRRYKVKAAPQSGAVTSHRYPVEAL